MVRAFIAVRIEATAALEAALAELGRMGRAVRGVAPENLHLTLRFLGSVEEMALVELDQAMRSAARGVGPMDLEIAGVGSFPSAHRPSVIWADVRGGDVEQLTLLAQGLEAAAVNLGFAPEGRPWTPHLTLARVKARPPAALAAFLDRHRNTRFGQARVESVDLMLSQLSSRGPTYSVAGAVPLSAASV